MKLCDLLLNIPVLNSFNEDIEVENITFDSRKCAAPNTLFVAVCGVSNDGHDYINSAISNGAKVIVYQKDIAKQAGVEYIQVEDSQECLGWIAANFYGNPSKKLTLVGVTGTNGKTTTATLLYNLHQAMGYKCGLLSTVVNYVDTQAVVATHTTPDPLELNKLLAQMVAAGCTYAFMEVSSHAVDQRRIAALQFAGGIFTNLTRDHLDYHKTVENYLAAKKRFFDELPANAFALFNSDDASYASMAKDTKAVIKTYSQTQKGDFTATINEMGFDGMSLNINGVDTHFHFTGKFNVSNLLAIYGAAVLLGHEPKKVLDVLSNLHPVSGRFEILKAPKGYSAIVDYAHTPDALENVCTTINSIRKEGERLITVVGCGGDRDKGKRPQMASIAEKQSDIVILTSDNPRTENPQAIIDDMLAGITDLERVIVEIDRAKAIEKACAVAQKGDVILIAGKGHEDYQIIGTTKHHFDDKEQVKLHF